MHASRIALLVASVLGMSCTFLPWVTVPFLGAVYGSSGDGWISFAVCLLTAVFALLGERRSQLPMALLLIGALCGAGTCLLGLWKIIQLKEAMAGNPFGAMVTIGPGLYLLVAAGAVIAFVPPLLSLRQASAPPRVQWSQPQPQPYWQPQAPQPQGYWPAQPRPDEWTPER